MKEHILS